MRIEQVISFQHVENSISEHVILYKGEAFTFYDMGLTRYVFANADKTKVIKIQNGSIIEQEFCLPIKFSDKKLNIAQMLFAKSCRNEVGWNKEGNLVCFDLDEYMRY